MTYVLSTRTLTLTNALYVYTNTITGGAPEDEALARMLVSNWARFVDTVQVGPFFCSACFA